MFDILMFDVLMVFLKEFFQKLDFEKKSADDNKKHKKLPSMQYKVKGHVTFQLSVPQENPYRCEETELPFLLQDIPTTTRPQTTAVSSADNLGKQFGPRSGPMKHRTLITVWTQIRPDETSGLIRVQTV